MSRTSIRRFVLSLVLAATALALPAWATDNYWTNQSGDGVVSNPLNWNLGHVPNSGENALILSGSQLVISNSRSLTADHVECSIPLYITNGFIFCNTITVNNTLTMYGSGQIYLKSSMQVNNVWNMFDATVSWFQTSVVPTITIAPSAQLVLWSGTKYIQDALVNRGVIQGGGQTLNIGSSLGSVEVLNTSNGLITDTSFVVLSGGLTPYVINQGSMTWNGGAPHLPVFGNEAYVFLNASQLTIDDLLDLDGDSRIDFGHWFLSNSSTLTHNNGGDISAIGPNASVRLDGGTNFFGGLPRVQSIEGHLEVAGTTFQMAPPFFGTVTLTGTLRMEDGGRIEVLGGFWMNGANALLDKVVTQPNDNDVLATYSSSSLGGTLLIEILNESLTPPGTSIPLVRDIGDCCFISGPFAAVAVYGTSHPSSVDYQQHLARLVIGGGLVGDLNCNGSVGFDDINPFVQYLSNFAAWQAAYPNCPATNGDINGDSVYGQGSFGDINPFVALLSGGK
jgi:hypothetical protein